MRLPALLGCVVLFAGCSTKEAPPTVDTTAVAAASASRLPLERVAGVWNVMVKPEGSDSVVTSYILNTTDTAGWLFAFPGGQPIHMRVTGLRGDTIMTETDSFESSLRKGVQARSNSVSWLQDGKMVGRTTVHYQTTGPDTVRVFMTEGTRQSN